EEGNLESNSGYSIKSQMIQLDSTKDDDDFNFLIRVDFKINIKSKDEKIDSHFKFVYIAELVSDEEIHKKIESKDRDFINISNQIAYSSVKSFVANFFMNSGYNPVHLPLMKMDY
ncbi:hypothetical protein, partial [Acinetobacter pittii]|uniref:hypothetical protein n=1 Tax=Acinetobacter pittii TaxID=48296 RepID=UPI002DBF0CCC